MTHRHSSFVTLPPPNPVKIILIGAVVGVTYAFVLDLDLTRHALLGAAALFWPWTGMRILHSALTKKPEEKP